MEWAIIGTSRWQNTVLIRSNDTTLLKHLATLDFVKDSRLVWVSPDSIERRSLKIKVHEKWNPWDSIKGERDNTAELDKTGTVPKYTVEDYVDEIDCLLIGPHLAHHLEDMEERCEGYDVKVAVIEKDAYARLNGEKTLDQILALFGEE